VVTPCNSLAILSLATRLNSPANLVSPAIPRNSPANLVNLVTPRNKVRLFPHM
jgi:hypothetical protein